MPHRLGICARSLTAILALVACSGSSNDSTAPSNGGTLGLPPSIGTTVSGASSSDGMKAYGGAAGAAVGGGAADRNVMDGKFAVPMLTIQVVNGASVTSKEDYVACEISIDGKGRFANYEAAANIRGRGNSTWLWYDKKPYRIKLDEKSEILGLAADKDWVLLANYRDPTFLMNAFAFEIAGWMGLPFTNHSRFVEVTLNGDYIGLYQLTEQVEQGTNRVAVADDGGILLSLDEDDGPTAAPNAGDNFTSLKYRLPVAVKYPESQSAAQLSAIRDDFAKVEQAIATADYDAIAKVLDIASLIDFLIVQEVTYNVELVTPRSMYLHRDPGGVYFMGPIWDFDGGFDFDWTTMLTGHDYFLAQDLLLGAEPARANTVSAFWVNLFKNARFVREYQNRWSAIKDTLLPHCWGVLDNWVASSAPALERNATRWPTGKDYQTEISRMKQWLMNRIAKLNATVSAYPVN